MRLIRALVGMVCIALSGCATSLDRAENPYRPGKVLMPMGPVAVPLVANDSPFLVDVMMNGQGPFRFILDSGASYVAISDETVARLKLARHPTMESPTAGGKILRHLDGTTVASIKVGSAEFQDVPAVIVPKLPANAGGVPIAGVLGFSMFWDVQWTLDSPGKLLVLWSDEDASRPSTVEVADTVAVSRSALHYPKPQWRSGDEMPLVTDRGTPVVTLDVNLDNPQQKDQVTAVLDTGGWFNFAFTPAWRTRLAGRPTQGARPDRTRAIFKSQGITAAGPKMIDTYAIKDATFGVGRHQFEMPWVDFQEDPGGRALIGMTAMEGFVLTFDRPHGKMWMYKPTPESEGPVLTQK